MNLFKIIVVIIQISLGALFVYGGVKKFIPKEKTQQSTTVAKQDLPDHVVKIKSFIGGMKQTGYFWQFLGVAELVCGLLLLSQYFALLGAVVLVPITLNIFLFHLFLESHEIGELLMTIGYLLANLLILAYNYPSLKSTFLNANSN